MKEGSILIFGGTTEGRELADLLASRKIPHAVSVATEYGAEMLSEVPGRTVLSGRKTEEDMLALMRDGSWLCAVDATHPYAVTVSAEIRRACEEAGLPCLRLRREMSAVCGKGEELVFADTVAEAAGILDGIEGKILMMTGSRDLAELLEGIRDRSRVYARVLPVPESLMKCEACGLSGRQIIAMQGPFSTEMNMALIRETGASVILTKETGRAGGYEEKLLAAEACGIKTVVLRNPERAAEIAGLTSEEILEALSMLTGTCLVKEDGTSGKRPESEAQNASAQRRDGSGAVPPGDQPGIRGIVLAGVGPGSEGYFTKELQETLRDADCLFGAQSVLANVGSGVPAVPLYQGEKILAYLEEHPEIRRPAAVFSGDTGLCSGAWSAGNVFRAAGWKVRTICGISSVTLFASRLHLRLEDCRIVSAHGRDCNVPGYVRKCEKLILLVSGRDHVQEICRELADLQDVMVTAGFELGSAREQVYELAVFNGNSGFAEEDAAGRPEQKKLREIRTPEELTGEGRYLLYIENPHAAEESAFAGISDEEMIRGNVPMTKEEIRALAVRKLRLTKKSVLYDIGAGTGSVSVEAALLHPDIRVFAIEKKEEALELLRRNKEKHHAANLTIVPGEAPDALKDLPAPTHAFIGGSGGRLKEILSILLEKDPQIRIVLDTVTLETLSETMDAIRDFGLSDPEVLQVSASRGRKAGRYHLMEANNPVTLFAVGGTEG